MSGLTSHQRRAWRLALLVTGRPDLADAALLEASRRRVALETLPESRRDRLTLICVREIVGEAAMRRPGLLDRLRAKHRRRRGVHGEAPVDEAASPFSGKAMRAIHAMATLREQPREAWALHRVLNLDLRDVARAMDCSKTAAARHLEEAEKAMVEALGADYTSFIDALRLQSDAAEAGAVVLESLAAARTARWVGRAALVVAGLALLGGAIWGVTAWMQATAP